MTRSRSILAVTAHPSDEVFNFGATLAHYAQQGVKVTLACATRGEGRGGPDRQRMEEQREGELRDACAILGLQPPVFLGYHDSGGLGAEHDGDPLALVNAPVMEVEARIREVIEREKPQIVLTFDPRGGNGHPDKLRVYQAVSAAFQFSGQLSLPPERLFLVARSLTFMEGLVAMSTGPWVNLDARLYATDESSMAARIDTRGQRATVMAAARAHASQGLSRLDDDTLNGVYGEALDWGTYTLAGSRGGRPKRQLEDLFESLSWEAQHPASRFQGGGVA